MAPGPCFCGLRALRFTVTHRGRPGILKYPHMCTGCRRRHRLQQGGMVGGTTLPHTCISGILGGVANEAQRFRVALMHAPVPFRRILCLLMLAVLAAGCGQKGDLYRPGKQSVSAAGLGFQVQS
jgi:predicted small lipoprotein YifL